MSYRLLLAASCAALASVVTPAFAEEQTAWRLFVSDHAAGVVNVIDTVKRQPIDSFETDGPATLHRTESGQTVFATQGQAGKVAVISSGIAFDDHGDHGDISVNPPRLLDLSFEGSKPAHFVERQGQIALFFDGEDKARLTSEQAILKGDGTTRDVSVEKAHHGVAVSFGEAAVVTVPNPEDASKRPIGARVVTAANQQSGDVHDCPGLHGSAGSGSIYALACDTGFLLLQPGDPNQISIEHMPYPASLPEGSSSTLIGGKGLQYFMGNYGPDRVIIIDPTDADDAKLIQLPTRRVHFAVDPIRPRFAYVFTEDGKLHRIDVVKGAIEKSLNVTDPYSMDGHWSDPRPRIAVAGDAVAVTDPLRGKIHMIDAASFEPAGDIAVEGKPFNVVAVGGSGQTHQTD